MVQITRRDFGAASLLALAAAGGVATSAAAQQTSAPPTGAMPHIDPELRNFQIGMPPAPTDGPELGSLSQRSIRGPRGAPEVLIHIINARASGAPRPGILHIHGGGYTMGSATMFMPQLREQAHALDCVIVSVDYRLAPATPFPGSLEDNYAGLKWMYANARQLGVDPSRIAVMGESAGGGHAAMLAIAARDRGEVPLKFQALIYPMLDDRTGSTHQPPPSIGTVAWTADLNRAGWTALLGVPAGSPNVPAGSVPARVENLSGLPPTYITVGGIDLFVEESVAYAQRLIAAGVPVGLNVVPGAFHGFDIFVPNASISRRFREATIDALRRGLAA